MEPGAVGLSVKALAWGGAALVALVAISVATACGNSGNNGRTVSQNDQPTVAPNAATASQKVEPTTQPTAKPTAEPTKEVAYKVTGTQGVFTFVAVDPGTSLDDLRVIAAGICKQENTVKSSSEPIRRLRPPNCP